MAVAERTKSEAQRREQILAAARDVFKEKGYESATISEIVRKAGVAQGTFYLYFGSKKSIVIDLARQPMAEMAQILMGALTGNESFSDVLKAFVKAGFEVGRINPDLCRIIHLAKDSEGSIRELETDNQVSDLSVDMFQRAVDSGEMVELNPAIASEMFRIIMVGAMALAFATDPRPASLEEIERATELVVLRAFVTDRT
jgi:AcrR family transcriptional regulator